MSMLDKDLKFGMVAGAALVAASIVSVANSPGKLEQRYEPFYIREADLELERNKTKQSVEKVVGLVARITGDEVERTTEFSCNRDLTPTILRDRDSSLTHVCTDAVIDQKIIAGNPPVSHRPATIKEKIVTFLDDGKLLIAGLVAAMSSFLLLGRREDKRMLEEMETRLIYAEAQRLRYINEQARRDNA